jgi:hypothetical protein
VLVANFAAFLDHGALGVAAIVLLEVLPFLRIELERQRREIRAVEEIVDLLLALGGLGGVSLTQD